MMDLLNQAQANYIANRCADRNVFHGMDLINKIQSTRYGQNALGKAKQRTQTRFDHYMIDVVGSKAAKDIYLPSILRYNIMIEEFANKTSREIKEEDIINIFKHFGFGERQTRMDLIDALNPEDELSDDTMLSENDMDNIILALSVCMYATLYV